MAVFMNEFRKDLSNSYFLNQNRRKICRLLPFKDDLRSNYTLFFEKNDHLTPPGATIKNEIFIFMHNFEKTICFFHVQFISVAIKYH